MELLLKTMKGTPGKDLVQRNQYTMKYGNAATE